MSSIRNLRTPNMKMLPSRTRRSDASKMRVFFDETSYSRSPQKSSVQSRRKKYSAEFSSSERSTDSPSSCLDDAPWSSPTWLHEYDYDPQQVANLPRLSVHQKLAGLLEASSFRMSKLGTYFGVDRPLRRGGAERQINLLLRSFREMIVCDDDTDHTWTRLEYCESHLPPALLNLERAVVDILCAPVQANFASFALFEVLFLHSHMAPGALFRRPPLLRFYQDFRLWLYDQVHIKNE